MHRFGKISAVLVALVATTVSCSSQVDEPEASTDSAVTVTPSSRCPSGNGFFVLYYGTNMDDMVRIKNAQPNFVVLGDGLEGRRDLTELFRLGGVRTFAYISVGRGLNDPNLVKARIETAMDTGYRGIFFDDVDDAKVAYNRDVADAVHQRGGRVIANPGKASVRPDIFDYADIVSSENKWSSTLDPSGVDPWRWLAVQGDPGGSSAADDQSPTDGATALARLREYRRRGGFWYYTTFPNVHYRLPAWFDEFATTVKGMAAAPCTAAPPPPPPPPPGVPPMNEAGTGPYVIGIHAFNRADNAEIPGLFATVQTTSGQIVLQGHTPIDFHLPAGEYRITTADYGPYTFHHWDTNAANPTLQPRPVTLTTSPSGLWTGAWYTVQ